MAVPALAHNGSHHHGHHGSHRALGLEMLQDLADIPRQRMRDLNCRYENSNNNLCRVERVRKRTAKRNIDHFNGRLMYVKRAILADINERDNRRYELNCGTRNWNRDLCRYERIVLNELHNVFLPEINQAIRHNKRHRDRIHRDRIERERRERARRDRIERERRQRERDRIKRERRRRGQDRAKPDRRRDRRDERRPRKPRKPRRR